MESIARNKHHRGMDMTLKNKTQTDKWVNRTQITVRVTMDVLAANKNEGHAEFCLNIPENDLQDNPKKTWRTLDAKFAEVAEKATADYYLKNAEEIEKITNLERIYPGYKIIGLEELLVEGLVSWYKTLITDPEDVLEIAKNGHDSCDRKIRLMNIIIQGPDGDRRNADFRPEELY